VAVRRDLGDPEAGAVDLGELLGRDFSAAVVMFHEAVAARLGLTAGENKALDVLARRGPISSGQLARELGLTPGAVTGLVDRLARAGYAERVPDAADRRKTLVRVDADRLAAEVAPVFASLREAVERLTDGYSPAQRATVQHFVTNVAAILREQTARLARQT
jgi:DNA-binding MarR family transcriptional regulator